MASVLASLRGAAEELLGFSKDGDGMLAQILRKHIPVCMMLFIGLIFYQYGDEKVSTTDIGDNKAPLSGDLAHGLCWSKGAYLYGELLQPQNFHLSGMGVGIPRNLKDSGFLRTHRNKNKSVSSMCQATDGDGQQINPDTCDPFHVVYYRQHHWLYQVLAAIVMIMAVPYLFDYVNTDRINMIDHVKSAKGSPHELIKQVTNKYFTRRGYCNTSFWRMLLTLFIKVVPMIAMIIVTHYFDRAFHGRFLSYIPDLYRWMRKEPVISNDYEFARIQNLVTPGDFMLPPILMCDISYSAFGDDANAVIFMRVLMEMNSNKIAQYWFMFISPLMLAYNVISVLDVLLFLVRWIMSCLKSFCSRIPKGPIFLDSPIHEILTARQIYLLDSLRWSDKEFAITLEHHLTKQSPERPPRANGLLSKQDDDDLNGDIPLSEVVIKGRQGS